MFCFDLLCLGCFVVVLLFGFGVPRCDCVCWVVVDVVVCVVCVVWLCVLLCSSCFV